MNETKCKFTDHPEPCKHHGTSKACRDCPGGRPPTSKEVERQIMDHIAGMYPFNILGGFIGGYEGNEKA